MRTTIHKTLGVLAAGLLLTGCPKHDDPLPSSETLPTTNTGRTATATAAAMTTLGALGALTTTSLTPRPIFGAPARVPSGLTYNDADTTYSYTAPSGLAVKITFLDTGGLTPLALWSENGVSTETINASALAALGYLRFNVAGVDNRQTVATVLNDSSFTSADIDAAGNILSDLSLNGTLTVAGPTGSFTFNSSSLVLGGSGADEGQISGPLTASAGASHLPDGTEVTVTLSLSQGTATGTAQVGTETIDITVDVNGVGTYTDGTGTHPIL